MGDICLGICSRSAVQRRFSGHSIVNCVKRKAACGYANMKRLPHSCSQNTHRREPTEWVPTATSPLFLFDYWGEYGSSLWPVMNIIWPPSSVQKSEPKQRRINAGILDGAEASRNGDCRRPKESSSPILPSPTGGQSRVASQKQAHPRSRSLHDKATRPRAR